MQLFSRSVHSIAIIGIDDKDQPLCVLIVMSPQRTQAILQIYLVMQSTIQSKNNLTWPPTSQIVKAMLLYSTVSTLNPAVSNNFCQSPRREFSRCSFKSTVEGSHHQSPNPPSPKHPPIVGTLDTTSPSLSLYKIVVLPPASRPSMSVRISFLPRTLVQLAP